jgi:hypothetical protein
LKFQNRSGSRRRRREGHRARRGVHAQIRTVKRATNDDVSAVTDVNRIERRGGEAGHGGGAKLDAGGDGRGGRGGISLGVKSGGGGVGVSYAVARHYGVVHVCQCDCWVSKRRSKKTLVVN